MQGRVCGSSKDGRSFVFDREVGPRGVDHLLRESLFFLAAWVEDDGLLPDAEINRMYWWHVIE